MNGLGAQGDPRGADVANPVTYPFKGLGGVTVDKQHAGERVYDINADGVAQYGLYPDWIQDLTKVADTPEERATARRSRTTWPAAPRPTCRCGSGPTASPPTRAATRACARGSPRSSTLVRRGMTTKAVMKAVGQPYQRLGSTYRFCARTGADPKVMMKVTFSRAGKVVGSSRRERPARSADPQPEAVRDAATEDDVALLVRGAGASSIAL